MNNSKTAIVISQIIEKIEMICGGIWAVFFFLMFIVDISMVKDDVAVGIIVLLMTMLGVWVFLCGRKREYMRLKFKEYVTQVASIDTMIYC